MEFQRYSAPLSFKANFVNNKAFQEVVDWAEKNNKLRALDIALNTIKIGNKGDITIFHGINPQGQIYSNFRHKHRSLINIAEKTPAESSYYGIINLALLGRKFKSLMGCSEITENVSKQSIIAQYASKTKP